LGGWKKQKSALFTIVRATLLLTASAVTIVSSENKVQAYVMKIIHYPYNEGYEIGEKTSRKLLYNCKNNMNFIKKEF
jgi:hypothetical protein